MVFSGDPQRPKVDVQPLKLSEDVISKLEAMTLLVYIPREVSGSEIHRSMRQNTEKMAHYMSVKRELCSLAKEELLEGDIEAFAKTVDLEYQLKKKQSPLTTTQNMDMLYRVARAHGALGMKFMGAGGGGCAIIFSEDKEGLAVALRDYAKVLDFKFEGMKK
jgi:D-glycero-alpha-D-manno-heptose-7-phosphate kinase